MPKRRDLYWSFYTTRSNTVMDYLARPLPFGLWRVTGTGIKRTVITRHPDSTVYRALSAQRAQNAG